MGGSPLARHMKSGDGFAVWGLVSRQGTSFTAIKVFGFGVWGLGFRVKASVKDVIPRRSIYTTIRKLGPSIPYSRRN